jgi:hypothetical protein
VALWGIAASVFGAVLAVAALTQPIRRRHLVVTAAVAYTLASAGAATLVSSFWVNLVAPGVLLLTGYWLSGLLFHSPQSWLEAWLLRSDRALGAERWMDGMPRLVAEALEASYAAVSVVVGVGAIWAATAGVEAVTDYWNLVLTAELACYVWLPWLRSRPPRTLEPQRAQKATPALRRLNTRILDNASVQANTLPSGHVSGAVAAALGVMAVNATAGWVLLAVAVAIAVAAVAGRYHYAVDCVTGAVTALIVFFALR